MLGSVWCKRCFGHSRKILEHHQRFPLLRVRNASTGNRATSGGRIFMGVGFVSATLGLTYVYAKYDESFRKSLLQHVLYSEEILRAADEAVAAIQRLAIRVEQSPVDAEVQQSPPQNSISVTVFDTKEVENALSNIKISSSATAAAHSKAVKSSEVLHRLLTKASSDKLPDQDIAQIIVQQNAVANLVLEAEDTAKRVKSDIASLQQLLQRKSALNDELKTQVQQSIANAKQSIEEASKNLQKAQNSVFLSETLETQIDKTKRIIDQEMEGVTVDKSQEISLPLIIACLHIKRYKELLKEQESNIDKMLLEKSENTLDPPEKESTGAVGKKHDSELDEALQNEDNKLRESYDQKIADIDAEWHKKLTALTRQHDKVASENASLQSRIVQITDMYNALSQELHSEVIAVGKEITNFTMVTKGYRKRVLDLMTAYSNLYSIAVKPIVTDTFKVYEDDTLPDSDVLSLIASKLPNPSNVTDIRTLQGKFLEVEANARKVAKIEECESIPTVKFIQSYICSKLPRKHANFTTEDLFNEEIGVVDNYGLLDRAKFCVEKGEFQQAIKYLNLLKGPAAYVVSDWSKEVGEAMLLADMTKTIAAYVALRCEASYPNLE